MSTLALELLLALATCGFGVVLIVLNREWGDLIKAWNQRPGMQGLNRALRTDRYYRTTPAGNYPFFIGMGVFTIVIGIMIAVVSFGANRA